MVKDSGRLTKEQIIERIKSCGQSIIDNTEKIAIEYDYSLGDLSIYCGDIEDRGAAPYIEVSTRFIPEGFIEQCVKGYTIGDK